MGGTRCSSTGLSHKGGGVLADSSVVTEDQCVPGVAVRRGEGHALDVEGSSTELPAGLEEDVDQERQMGEGMARTGEDAELGREVRWSLWGVLADAKGMASPDMAGHPIFFWWDMLVSFRGAANSNVDVPILPVG